MGIVLSLDLLSTKLRTFANLFVRIPNENILKNSVKTFSKYKIRRITVDFSIAYKEKIAEAKEVVRKFPKASPLVLEDPKPMTIATSLADSGVLLEGIVWIDRTQLLKAKDVVTAGIKKALDDAGIEIPHPHLTLYLGDPKLLSKKGSAVAPFGARIPKTRILPLKHSHRPKRKNHQ